MDRIGAARSACNQILTGAVDELLHRSIGRSEVADEHALMVLGPAFEHGGDEGNAEAPAPVPAEVREARSFVILVLGQIRIGELRHRHEHEGIAEALIGAGKRKMEVISLRSETAIIEHRKRGDGEACAQQRSGAYAWD